MFDPNLFAGWLWWRVRLAIGWTLKRVGYAVSDTGWKLINRAILDYRDEFRRFQGNRP